MSSTERAAASVLAEADLVDEMPRGIVSHLHVDDAIGNCLEAADCLPELAPGPAVLHALLELPAQDVDDSYLLGYAQLEYEANNVVTVFGRLEGGIDQDGSAYLALFEAFITERYMLGVRLDVAEHHALTAELANTTFGAGPTGSRDFNELRLQWSAVFP